MQSSNPSRSKKLISVMFCQLGAIVVMLAGMRPIYHLLFVPRFLMTYSEPSDGAVTQTAFLAIARFGVAYLLWRIGSDLRTSRVNRTLAAGLLISAALAACVVFCGLNLRPRHPYEIDDVYAMRVSGGATWSQPSSSPRLFLQAYANGLETPPVLVSP